MDQISAEAVLDGMDQLIGTLEQRDAVLGETLDRLGDASLVAVTGLPLAGKSSVAADLVRLAAVRGRDAEVVGIDGVAAASDGLTLVDASAVEHVKRELPYDARLSVLADEDALVLRARGRRIGPAPIERLEVDLPAARLALERDAEPTVTLDVTNPLAPKVLSGRATG